MNEQTCASCEQPIVPGAVHWCGQSIEQPNGVRAMAATPTEYGEGTEVERLRSEIAAAKEQVEEFEIALAECRANQQHTNEWCQQEIASARATAKVAFDNAETWRCDAAEAHEAARTVTNAYAASKQYHGEVIARQDAVIRDLRRQGASPQTLDICLRAHNLIAAKIHATRGSEEGYPYPDEHDLVREIRLLLSIQLDMYNECWTCSALVPKGTEVCPHCHSASLPF